MMNSVLKEAFELEILNAQNLIKANEYSKAFIALERAHILGQKFVMPHTLAHLYMLKIAFLTADIKEIFGQLIRIPLGILGSLIGIVPVGNSGGSNVSAFKKMQIPDDLKKILETK